MSHKKEKMKKPPVQVYFDVPISGHENEDEERRMDAKWPSGLDLERVKKDLLEYVRSGLLVGKQRATVALIKPDAVKDGLVKQIKKQIRDSGLHIIAEAHKKLTKIEAIALYSKHADKEYFDELTTFMSSGPAHILVLVDDGAHENLPKRDANVINRLRDVVGPTDIDSARVEQPRSIRGMFATSTLKNAIHASSDVEDAKRELLFFFPDLDKTKDESSDKCLIILYNLSHTDELLEKLKSSGFEVLKQKEIMMSRGEVEQLYSGEEGEDWYEEKVNSITSNKSLVLLISRTDCIKEWQQLMDAEGEDGLSKQWREPDSPLPTLYGSKSVEEYVRDQELLFPLQRTLAIIKPDAYPKKDEILRRIDEAGFQIVNEMECVLPTDKIESLYHEHINKSWFTDFTAFMTSGPSVCLILQKDDAIQVWRQLIGPTDPIDARESHPRSLRALYGESIMKNALHGSSSPEQADHRSGAAFPMTVLPTVTEEEEGEPEVEESDVRMATPTESNAT